MHASRADQSCHAAILSCKISGWGTTCWFKRHHQTDLDRRAGPHYDCSVQRCILTTALQAFQSLNFKTNIIGRKRFILKLLVTGGAGYIGTHTMVELLNAGHDISVIDDLSNSHIAALAQVKKLTKRNLMFTQADLCDAAAVAAVLQRFRPDGVIHFAGLKAVGDSVARPLDYYRQNVGGTLCLLTEMDRLGCRKIVFSSSATVYELPKYLSYDEQHPTKPVNPYGRTKLVIEHILRDWNSTHHDASALCLRYFNPAEAHP